MTDTTDTTNQSAIETLVSKLTQLWWRAEASLEKVGNSLKMNTAAQESGTLVARKVINCPDERMTASDNAHINVNRFTLPKDARDIIIATVMAAAILTIVILAFLLHDAYKDIKTQVWLRDDALTKFMSGPYADLRAEVKANQIVIATLGSQCLKPKESKP